MKESKGRFLLDSRAWVEHSDRHCDLQQSLEKLEDATLSLWLGWISLCTTQHIQCYVSVRLVPIPHTASQRRVGWLNSRYCNFGVHCSYSNWSDLRDRHLRLATKISLGEKEDLFGDESWSLQQGIFRLSTVFETSPSLEALPHRHHLPANRS